MTIEEARTDTGNISSKEIIPRDNLTHLVIRSQEANIDTRNIADVFGRPHDKVMQTINSLILDRTISTSEFSESDFTVRGKKYRCIELNKGGFLKAMPFIGGRKSREGQRVLVDEFMLLEKLLAKQSKVRETVAFQLMRSEGRDARKILTDAISRYINYAKANGSQGADQYYSIITSQIYKSFLVVEPKASALRDLLTAVQLSELQTIELMAVDILTKGIDSKQIYKKIYRELKSELNAFTSSKTKILDC
jgi:phage regulator Rha-like protein